MENSEVEPHPMLVPGNKSENDSEKIQEISSGDAVVPINLITPEFIVPDSQSRKYIKITIESESGSDKNFVFHDSDNKLLFNSKLSQGSFSKSAKCVVQNANEGAHDPMSFDAKSKICCNGKWKIAELRNGTGAVTGVIEMRIPVNIDVSYPSEAGLAVSINNNNGKALFKIKMSSGPQPSRKARRGRNRRRAHPVAEQPFIFEVLSAAYGQTSVGKIFRTNAVYSYCSTSIPRGYTFEYFLPLDSEPLSLIMCGVMALETSFTDQERNGKYLMIIFGIFLCLFVLMQILLITLL